MKIHNCDQAPETHGHTITWWAPLYDAFSSLASFGSLPKIRRTTVRAARLQPGESVLDVGCGTGDLTLRAARKVGDEGRVAGIDASPDMIKIARGKAEKQGRAVDFRTVPVEDMPFADGEFDAALSSFMVHHLPDDLKTVGMAEVRRVLKPGGRLIVADLKPGRGVMGFVAGLIGHKLPEDYDQRLVSTLRAAGFAEVEVLDVKNNMAIFIRATK